MNEQVEKRKGWPGEAGTKQELTLFWVGPFKLIEKSFYGGFFFEKILKSPEHIVLMVEELFNKPE